MIYETVLNISVPGCAVLGIMTPALKMTKLASWPQADSRAGAAALRVPAWRNPQDNREKSAGVNVQYACFCLFGKIVDLVVLYVFPAVKIPRLLNSGTQYTGDNRLLFLAVT